MVYAKLISFPLMVPVRGTSPLERFTVPVSFSPSTLNINPNGLAPPGVFIDAAHSPATDVCAPVSALNINSPKAKNVSRKRYFILRMITFPLFVYQKENRPPFQTACGNKLEARATGSRPNHLYVSLARCGL